MSKKSVYNNNNNNRHNKHKNSSSIKTVLISFVLGLLTGILVLKKKGPNEVVTRTPSSLFSSSSDSCAITFGKYHGSEYKVNDQTIGQPKCLIESKFLKVSQHAVQFTKENDIIPDWIWIDYHDRINVLVEAPKNNNQTNDQQNSYLIMEQTKYALDGRISLAIVGGIIEPNELPEHAAQREVFEELHVQCTNYHFLGRYRTDVNRGMGWTNTYVATDCNYSTNKKTLEDDSNQKEDPRKEEEEVGIADTEKQNIKIMSYNEVLQAVLDGKFLEIQWTATIALAMLYKQQQQDER